MLLWVWSNQVVSMINDRLLAFGLLLSTATQLRLPGTPWGAGEALLTIWIIGALADLAYRGAPALTRPLSHMLLFWAVFTFAQSIGLLLGLATDNIYPSGVLHTGQAYAFVAILSLLLVILPAWRLHRVAWTFSVGGAVAVILLIAGGYGMVPMPGLGFWEWNRFIGWSMNPNQFGLLCTVLVLLSLQRAEAAARPHTKIFALSCMVPPFIAGILTRSDSFTVAIGFAVPLFVGSKFLIRFMRAERHPSLVMTVACLMILSLPLLLASVTPFTPKIAENARQAIVETMSENDQAEDRFRLWSEAVDIGLKSGMLGLGPGPHLLGKRTKLPPPEKAEAHNTALDLITQGGILAMLIFFWIITVALIAAYRAGLIALASLIFSLFVYSNFHLVVRHPIFWFSVVLGLAAMHSVAPRKLTSARPLDISPSAPRTRA